MRHKFSLWRRLKSPACSSLGLYQSAKAIHAVDIRLTKFWINIWIFINKLDISIYRGLVGDFSFLKKKEDLARVPYERTRLLGNMELQTASARKSMFPLQIATLYDRSIILESRRAQPICAITG